jgi:hypothetical protein
MTHSEQKTGDSVVILANTTLSSSTLGLYPGIRNDIHMAQ